LQAVRLVRFALPMRRAQGAGRVVLPESTSSFDGVAADSGKTGC
jgi:hypothetical protein